MLRQPKPFYAQYFKLKRFQIGVPSRIPRPPFLRQVILPIDLQIQHQIQANEIQRVRPNRMLTAELFPQQSTSAHKLPHISSELVGGLALFTSKLDAFRIAFWFVIDCHG